MKNLLTLTPVKISLFISIITVMAYLAEPAFIEMIELKTLDLRFLTRGARQPGNEVAIVAIDEKSLDELGKWPWPRKTIADLIDALRKYEVKSAGFDIVFAEPDQKNIRTTTDLIKGKIASLGIESDTLTSYINSLASDSDNDSILAESIKGFERVILGYFFHTTGQDLKHLRNEDHAALEVMKASAYSSVEYIGQPPVNGIPYVPDNFSVEANIEHLSRAARGLGYFNVFPDIDGTVRWAPLIMRYRDAYFPPLSLQLARHYMGNPSLSVLAAGFGIYSINIGETEIPTDERGSLLINYRGGSKMFPHYSVYDVINGEIPPKKLKDKIILIGATAIGIYDMRVTPFSGIFPGIEVHANVIDNILRGDFLRRPDWIGYIDILIIIVAGTMLGMILPRLGAISGAAAILSMLGLFLTGNYYAFSSGIWLNLTYPLSAMVGIYTCTTALHYLTEQREKNKVRHAFQYYLTSSVVHEVLKDPTKLKLGGDKKILSVLFSDIRDFTGISEKMQPEELVHFMNEYLTSMTDIVFKNEGLLDKYIGDAIMAVYGAPLDQPDHPMRVCLTALEMVEELDKLRIKWEDQGIPAIDVGIGISTGPMFIGNMGSSRRFDYTVMGDTVNLGARLEGLNKVYGTNIIISEGTYNAVNERLMCRELDAVRVKGKREPVRIYELLSSKGKGRGDEELAERFTAALSLYRTREWRKAAVSFQEVLAIRPEDLPAKIFINRCQLLASSPPPPEWDGVFDIHTK